MLYELTMTTDYVGHWGEWEAVREILQNAIDRGNPVVKQSVAHGIQIISRGVTLSPRSLLLGYSDKRGDDTKIGQFGEGYKLACLVLCRMGIEVTITNGPKIWTPLIDYSRKYGCDILCIDERINPDEHCNDLIFDIDVDPEAINLNKYYLPTAKPNSILMHRPGQMYVSGLYICTVKDFEHGYNFSPDRVRLGRDRQMLSSFDVSYEAGRIWSDTESTEKIFQMMENDVPDVEYLGSHRHKTCKAVAEHYFEKHGDTVPCSTQQEIEECGGKPYRLVPTALKYLIRKFRSYVQHFFGTPLERLEKWKERWSGRIPSDAVGELDEIIKAMGGKKNEQEVPF